MERTIGTDNKPYYSVKDELSDADYPMDCMIDDKVLKQILKVCTVGKSCVVSAKGASGNGGGYLIEKVFEVQRGAPWMDEAIKEKAQQK